MHARPGTLVLGHARDDRQSLALLLAPFLIIALTLAGQQSLRPPLALPPLPSARLAAATDPLQVPVASRPSGPQTLPAAAPPAISEPPAVATATLLEERTTAMARRAAPQAGQAPGTAMPAPAAPAPVAAAMPTPAAPTEPAADRRTQPEGWRSAALDLAPAPALPIVAPRPSRPIPEAPPASLPSPPPDLTQPPPATEPVAGLCAAPPGLLDKVARGAASPPATEPFGLALAAAARAQLDDLVIYNARYVRISYPMGDVPRLYGVCTDVVVRAYRALGIDLQELIAATRSGRGDASIDHRRVEVVRRFLDRHGEALPITDLAEDYGPGDIVTYYRPQNRSSTQHIAIVTDVRAPSGRLMIVHNRGWGPQLEDALFVDKITGHYRFAGLGAHLRGHEARIANAAVQSPWAARTAAPARSGIDQAACRTEAGPQPPRPRPLLSIATAEPELCRPAAHRLAPPEPERAVRPSRGSPSSRLAESRIGPRATSP